ncbi:hypothetical protein B0H66DRAFT_96495 [Apodospora peruviana]|uniref:SRR1-like domain-containing protein n=1 Tax=Apodospora peruviana TaxID=516989 RepID=A0AAE0MH00_9PEZI|nr:hypothetical protein B0H66DRAFT_96495 [Apodospora peruviana]
MESDQEDIVEDDVTTFIPVGDLGSAQVEAMTGIKAITKIRALYAAGVPLFTKENLRYIAQVQDECRRRGFGIHEVILRGFNGSDVRCEVCNHEPVLEFRIEYLSIQKLEGLWGWFDPRGDQPWLTIGFKSYMPNRRTSSEGPDNPPATSVEYLNEGFHFVKTKWEASGYYGRLRRTLASINPPPVLTKVIGLACGPLCSVARAELDHRGISQHLLLLTLREAFSNDGRQIECYSQDPIYNENEKQILESLGIRVLEDPMGFVEVDEGSVVVSISPNVPVKQIIADIARPAMIIWYPRLVKLDPSMETGWTYTDPDSARVDKMLEDYDKIEFPPHFNIGPVELYVRKH